MSKIKTEKNNSIDFVVVSNDNESAVFKRTINRNGRTAKEIKKIEASLTTTTLHYFDKDDFDNLKRIEAELSMVIANNFKTKRSIVDILYSFLEIK